MCLAIIIILMNMMIIMMIIMMTRTSVRGNQLSNATCLIVTDFLQARRISD